MFNEPSSTYQGFYIGVVVGVEDPEFRGRVMVYVPGVMKYLYDKAQGPKDPEKDAEDYEIASLVDSDFVDYLDGKKPDYLRGLRHNLPWAEQVAPIFGGATSLNINLRSGVETKDKVENVVDAPTFKNYKGDDGELGQEFKNKTPRIDPQFLLIKEQPMCIDTPNGSSEINDSLSQNWFQHCLVDEDNPSNLGTAGSSRGIISVPAVGAKVWVFFLGGDPNRPVYFGAVQESTNILSTGR